MVTIAVTPEEAGETRVALSPETAKKLTALGAIVKVASGAGSRSRFSDAAYQAAGATIAATPSEAASGADILLKVRRPTADEVKSLKPGAIVAAMVNPFDDRPGLDALAGAGASLFSMEFMPRISRAQSMDVLSSQANLAGYKAVVDAMAAYGRVLPMMMTAAGTVTPAKVFIVGAGVAGLQAIATARRMGAVVTATDVRPAAREETESLGAKFVGFVPADAATSGGYARPLTPEEQAEQAKMVAEHLKTQDIVITTAQIPGRKAPRIITAEMVRSMKPGAIVLDMAAESGGNVEGAVPGQTVDVGGVQLIGARNLTSRIAPATTVLYARNLFNFVQLLVDPKTQELKIDTADDLIKGALLTSGGAVVHDAFKPAA
jgi:NAD(P) transhydrogenase subunit alpha